MSYQQLQSSSGSETRTDCTRLAVNSIEKKIILALIGQNRNPSVRSTDFGCLFPEKIVVKGYLTRDTCYATGGTRK